MVAIDFEEQFDKYLDKIQESKPKNRNTSIGASEVTGCQTALYMDKVGGYEIDEDYKINGYAYRGNILEDNFVVPFLEHIFTSLFKGIEMYNFGEDQEKFFLEDDMSVTPDGIVYKIDKDAFSKYGLEDTETDYVYIEIKTFDPKKQYGIRSRAEYKHKIQTNVGMNILHRKLGLDMKWGVIIYVNCSNLKDIHLHFVEMDKGEFNSHYYYVKDTMKKIRNKDTAKLLTNGKQNGDCKWCKFSTACGKLHGEKIVKTTPVENESSTLKKDIITYKDRELKIKELKETNQRLMFKIEDMLKETTEKEIFFEDINSGAYIATQKGRKTFDQSKAKEFILENNENVDNFYKIGEEKQVLKIK